MAVTLNAVMTGGNDANNDTYQVSAATSFSASPMTVASGATLLVVAINWFATASGDRPTTRSVTWDGVAMNEAIFHDLIGALSRSSTGIYTLVNPAVGAKTLAGSWTNSMDVYVGAVSFAGTDTTTGYNSADNAYMELTTSINVTGSSDGATVATFITDGAEATTSQTKFLGDQALNPGGSGSYQLGTGGTITHSFTGAGGSQQTATAIHVIAGAAGGGFTRLVGPFGYPLIGRL